MYQTPPATSNDVIVSREYLEILEQHYRRCPQVDENSRAFLRDGSANLPGLRRPKHTSETSERVTECEVAFVQYPGASNCPQRPKEPISNTSKKRKRADTNWDYFVKNSPKASNWHEKEIELVGNVEKFESLLRLIAGESGKLTNTAVENEPSGKDLVAIGIQLAQSTMSFAEKARYETAFSRFQLLVVSSYCAFLETNNVSRDKIDGILQCLTMIQENDRRRLPKRAARIHSFICALEKGGWPINRATELFILSKGSKTPTIASR